MHIDRSTPDWRIEETLISRRRIRASHLIEFDDVVGRDHAGVGGLELPGNALLLAPREDPVHSIGHDQERTVVHLRDEVAKRDADRPRQPHGPAITSHRGEVTVSASERLAVTVRRPLGDLHVRCAR